MMLQYYFMSVTMSKESLEKNIFMTGGSSPSVGSPSSFILEESSPSVKDDDQNRTIPTHLVALEQAMMSLFFENTEAYPTAKNLLDFLHHDTSSKTLFTDFTHWTIAQYTKYLVKQMSPLSVQKNSSIAIDPATIETFREDFSIQEEVSSLKNKSKATTMRSGRVEREIRRLFVATTKLEPTDKNLWNFIATDPRAKSLYTHISPATLSAFKKRLKKWLNLSKNEKVTFIPSLEIVEQNNPDLGINAPTVVAFSKKSQRIGPKEQEMIQLFVNSTKKSPSAKNLWEFFKEDSSKTLYKKFHINTVKSFKNRIASELGLLDVKKRSEKNVTTIVEGYRKEHPTWSLSELKTFSRNRIPQIAVELNTTKASVSSYLTTFFKKRGEPSHCYRKQLEPGLRSAKKIKTVQKSLVPTNTIAEQKDFEKKALIQHAASIESHAMDNPLSQQIFSTPLSISDTYKPSSIFNRSDIFAPKMMSIGDKQPYLTNRFR